MTWNKYIALFLITISTIGNIANAASTGPGDPHARHSEQTTYNIGTPRAGSGAPVEESAASTLASSSSGSTAGTVPSIVTVDASILNSIASPVMEYIASTRIYTGLTYLLSPSSGSTMDIATGSSTLVERDVTSTPTSTSSGSTMDAGAGSPEETIPAVTGLSDDELRTLNAITTPIIDYINQTSIYHGLAHLSTLSPEARHNFSDALLRSHKEFARRSEHKLIEADGKFKDIFTGIRVSDDIMNAAFPDIDNIIDRAIKKHLLTRVLITENGHLSPEQVTYLLSQYTSCDKIENWTNWLSTKNQFKFIVEDVENIPAHILFLRGASKEKEDLTFIYTTQDETLYLPYKTHLPGYLSKLVIFGDNVKKIESYSFNNPMELTNTRSEKLANCPRLKSVDISALRNLTTIGDHVFEDCPQLESMDLSFSKHLNSIGINFLACCIKIRHTNFSNLRNLTSIGDGFLYHKDRTVLVLPSVTWTDSFFGNYQTTYHPNLMQYVWVNNLPDSVKMLITGHLPKAYQPMLTDISREYSRISPSSTSPSSGSIGGAGGSTS